MRKIFILFLLGSLWCSYTKSRTGFDLNRGNFYTVITGENLKEIDGVIQALDKTDGNEAFKGALRMKKSGFLSEAKDKLKIFKIGHKELESAIAKDSANTEYRFLRLLIQENAPKIVNYNREIKKDASYLRKNYENLPAIVQKALLHYSKTSKRAEAERF